MNLVTLFLLLIFALLVVILLGKVVWAKQREKSDKEEVDSEQYQHEDSQANAYFVRIGELACIPKWDHRRCNVATDSDFKGSPVQESKRAWPYSLAR